MKRNIMLCGLLMTAQLAALSWASSIGADAAEPTNIRRSLGCCCEDPTCPPGCDVACPPDCVLKCLQDCCLDPSCPADCDAECSAECAAGKAACTIAAD